MEVRDGLAFNQSDLAEAVVTRGQLALLDIHPELEQFRADSGFSLAISQGGMA